MSSASAAKPAAAYKNVVRGKLSLKGAKKATPIGGAAAAAAASGIKRKKEETEAERIEREDRELERLLANKQEMEAKAAAAATPAATSGLDREAADKQTEIDDIEADSTMTKSEKDFQRAQRQRELEMIRKKISKTHRQRVEEYNTYLGNLSEHNDIPRVGPG